MGTLPVPSVVPGGYTPLDDETSEAAKDLGRLGQGRGSGLAGGEAGRRADWPACGRVGVAAGHFRPLASAAGDGAARENGLHAWNISLKKIREISFFLLRKVLLADCCVIVVGENESRGRWVRFPLKVDTNLPFSVMTKFRRDTNANFAVWDR